MNTKPTKIDLREYWQIVWRRKLWVILPFIGTVGLAIAYSFYLQPLYESSTTVMIGRTRLLSRSVERMIPGVTGREGLDTIRRQILSREYLRQLINILDLKNDEQLHTQAAKLESQYPDLSTDEIMEMILINRLRGYFKVSQKGRDFIEISAMGYDPNIVYIFAKTLTQIFIDESLKREIGGVRGALDFSKEQLAIYKQKLEQSEENLRKFKQGLLQEQIEEQQVSATKLNQINSIILATDTDLREKKDELEYLTSKIGSRYKEGMPFSSRIIALKAQVLEQITRVSELMLKLTWKDAQVIRLNEEIHRLKQNLRNEIERTAIAYFNTNDDNLFNMLVQREMTRMEMDFLQRKKTILADLVNLYKRSLTRGPSQEITLSRLQREVELNREIYNMFLQQIQGSQIEEALQRTEAEFKYRIVEPAMKPLRPIKPNKKKILLLGCFMGLMLGAGLVYLLEYMDRSFKNVEDVENYLSIPVLATIPKMTLPKEKRVT